MSSLRFRQCPCCGAGQFSRVFFNPQLAQIADWRSFFYGSRRYIKDIYSCDACGYRFINEIEPGYVRHYQAQVPAEGERLAPFRNRYFQKVKRQVISQIPALGGTPSIMDVGCADGAWLDLWAGENRVGVEYSQSHRENLSKKGIRAIEPEHRPNAGTFDVVSLFDVLEHLENPRQELEGLRCNLKTSGALVIGIPDMGKLAARLLGSRYYLVCPMHFSYFTRRSIEALLKNTFPERTVIIKESPPMEADLQGILKWLPLGKIVPDSINFPVPLGYSASLICTVK